MSKVLHSYRKHLHIIGERLVGRDLRAKVGVSDIVQMVLVDFWRDRSKIQAKTDAERIGWLRSAFLHQLLNARRRYRTSGRNLAREVAIGQNAEDFAATDMTTLGEHEYRSELANAIDAAVSRLPAHYRVVIDLRSMQKLSFLEVGRQLGLSEDAATKLYARAIRKLRQILGPQHDPGR